MFSGETPDGPASGAVGAAGPPEGMSSIAIGGRLLENVDVKGLQLRRRGRFRRRGLQKHDEDGVLIEHVGGNCGRGRFHRHRRRRGRAALHLEDGEAVRPNAASGSRGIGRPVALELSVQGGSRQRAGGGQ